MSSDSIAGGDSDSGSVWGDGGSPRDAAPARKKVAKSVGLRAYLVIAPPEMRNKAGSEGGGHVGNFSVQDLALARIVASPMGGTTGSDARDALRTLALRQLKRREAAKGFLEYESQCFVQLKQPMEIDEAQTTSPTQDLFNLVGDAIGDVHDFVDRGASPRATTLQCLMQEWMAKRRPAAMASAMLGESVRSKVLDDRCHYFHCVAITGKINRKLFIVPGDPSKKRLKTMLADLPSLPAPVRQPLPEFSWNRPKGAKDPELVLYWMDCSMDLKEQRNAAASAKKFARLLSLKSGIPAEDMLKDMEFVSGRLLIKSRIRLDCAAMLLHRRWWADLCQQPGLVSVYLFCDSSPQWRGVELYAATMDIVIGGVLFRRLAPLVALDKTQLDLSGKVAALLWQAFRWWVPHGVR